MDTKRKMMAIMICAALLFAAAGVHADTLVNWSTGAAYMENLGNTTSDGRNEYNQIDTQCDKVWLYTASGSLTLALGVPQIVLVNPLAFEVGWTGDMAEDETKTNYYSLTRDITVNGVTRPLASPITHVVTYYQDSLLVTQGSPVAFGDIVVMPLGWSTGFFTDSAGTYTQTTPSWHPISPVYAEFCLIESPPTAITLASFEARPGSNRVALSWTTETETDNAGFNILRAEAADGPYVKINAAVIPAKAGAAQGAAYQFTDSTAQNRTTYHYKLQDIGLDGIATDHGPVSTTPRFVFGFGK